MSKKGATQVFPPVKSMSMRQIWDESFALWLRFVAEVGVNHVFRHGADFDEFYNALLYPKYEITLVTSEDLGVDDGVPMFGKCLPKDNTAFVDPKFFDTRGPRKVFIEIHETIGMVFSTDHFRARMPPNIPSCTLQRMGLLRGTRAIASIGSRWALLSGRPVHLQSMPSRRGTLCCACMERRSEGSEGSSSAGPVRISLFAMGLHAEHIYARRFNLPG
jgi:hypothetical protein